jgi:hypothetical protein
LLWYCDVKESVVTYTQSRTRPMALEEKSESSCDEENSNTPMVISTASIYSTAEYVTPVTNLPMIMTGTTLPDLEMLCRGKETYLRAEYCAQEESVFVREHGMYADGGAAPCRPPRHVTHTIAATDIATSLLEKTQNEDEGKRPEGTSGVGVNSVVITSSCIRP